MRALDFKNECTQRVLCAIKTRYKKMLKAIREGGYRFSEFKEEKRRKAYGEVFEKIMDKITPSDAMIEEIFAYFGIEDNEEFKQKLKDIPHLPFVGSKNNEEEFFGAKVPKFKTESKFEKRLTDEEILNFYGNVFDELVISGIQNLKDEDQKNLLSAVGAGDYAEFERLCREKVPFILNNREKFLANLNEASNNAEYGIEATFQVFLPLDEMVGKKANKFRRTLLDAVSKEDFKAFWEVLGSKFFDQFTGLRELIVPSAEDVFGDLEYEYSTTKIPDNYLMRAIVSNAPDSMKYVPNAMQVMTSNTRAFYSLTKKYLSFRVNDDLSVLTIVHENLHALNDLIPSENALGKLNRCENLNEILTEYFSYEITKKLRERGEDFGMNFYDAPTSYDAGIFLIQPILDRFKEDFKRAYVSENPIQLLQKTFSPYVQNADKFLTFLDDATRNVCKTSMDAMKAMRRTLFCLNPELKSRVKEDCSFGEFFIFFKNNEAELVGLVEEYLGKEFVGEDKQSRTNRNRQKKFSQILNKWCGQVDAVDRVHKTLQKIAEAEKPIKVREKRKEQSNICADDLNV